MLRHDVLEDPLTAALQPPLDETPEEKTKRLKREIKAKRVSDGIDVALRAERDELKRRRAQRPEVKLLLLGQASSGKSTLLKQFQLYYAPDMVDAQRSSWRPVVYFNIIKAIAGILDALEQVAYFDSHPELAQLRMTLLPLADLEPALAVQISGGVYVTGTGTSSPYGQDAYVRPGWQTLAKGKMKSSRTTGDSAYSSHIPAAEETAAWRIAACKDDIHALWLHPAVQALSKKQLQLEDSAAFFLESIQRIAWPDYVPSVDDVLHVRLQTLGVTEHQFEVSLLGKNVNLCLYDVGGARGHRPKWVPYFDSAHAIIFLAPLSAYDQYLEEDRRTNRIDDSLQLWTEICKNQVLKNLHLVLFLNKTDVLKAKLAAGIKVKKYITSFGDRPNEYTEVSQYFRAHFLQVHRRNVTGRRVLYTHFTSVIDTKATQTIIVNVADSIMRDYFAEARLV
ncbi:guanine nucleotide binding protein, alpha subunit [Exidia glandulosa HHB12029]|uniref:Guanine nucleotide binding protein, alpha subunit n=1 Tax=Exidia glandulosa HHB12029 TaxID=1314781 RepID=A0A165PAV0_EXIGL|nr:guanine nucleotide binding protein, alpha subunit [Exidia glandulosa HHB12029]